MVIFLEENHARLHHMKIVMATPLYPPDIAEPAPYTKHLAELFCDKETVTVVTYGRLPEQVHGVRIVAVDKRSPLPLRLVRYFFALLFASRQADILYAQNGASVELPAGIVSLLTRTPLILSTYDDVARKRAGESGLLGMMFRFAAKRAHVVIWNEAKESAHVRAVVRPLPRPEILPFRQHDEAAEKEYAASWEKHVAVLMEIFEHAAR